MILPDEDLVVVLPSVLDESYEFRALNPRVSDLVVWDCQSVERVNSVGLSNWIQCFRNLDPRQQYVFRKVPRRIVEIFNNVCDFLPTFYRVESFYFPYSCEFCDHEEDEFFVRGKDYLEAQSATSHSVSRIPAQLNCPKCQGMMEPTMKPEVYMRFLSYREADAISKA